MTAEKKVKTSYCAGLATRDLIINEATQMIAEFGYHGVTVRDLARRIGISHPAVIYHFANKEALAQAVIQRFEERVGIVEVALDEETGLLKPVGIRPKDYQEYVIALMRLAQQPDVAQGLGFSAVIEWEPINTTHPLYEYAQARRALITDFIFRETHRLKELGSWQFVVDEEFVARTLLTLWAGTVHQARSNSDFEYNIDCVASFLATSVVLLKIAPSELVGLSSKMPQDLAPMFMRVMHHVSTYLE